MQEQFYDNYPTPDTTVQYNETNGSGTHQWYSGICGVDSVFNNRQRDVTTNTVSNVPCNRYN